MSYVSCSPNGLAVRLAPSVQHPMYIYIYIFCAQSTSVQRPIKRALSCTDASEQSEPSEPNGEPVWTAIHIRHAKICT